MTDHRIAVYVCVRARERETHTETETRQRENDANVLLQQMAEDSIIIKWCAAHCVIPLSLV